jgi:hypothetical protein
MAAAKPGAPSHYSAPEAAQPAPAGRRLPSSRAADIWWAARAHASPSPGARAPLPTTRPAHLAPTSPTSPTSPLATLRTSPPPTRAARARSLAPRRNTPTPSHPQLPPPCPPRAVGVLLYRLLVGKYPYEAAPGPKGPERPLSPDGAGATGVGGKLQKILAVGPQGVGLRAHRVPPQREPPLRWHWAQPTFLTQPPPHPRSARQRLVPSGDEGGGAGIFPPSVRMRLTSACVDLLKRVRGRARGRPAARQRGRARGPLACQARSMQPLQMGVAGLSAGPLTLLHPPPLVARTPPPPTHPPDPDRGPRPAHHTDGHQAPPLVPAVFRSVGRARAARAAAAGARAAGRPDRRRGPRRHPGVAGGPHPLGLRPGFLPLLRARTISTSPHPLPPFTLSHPPFPGGAPTGRQPQRLLCVVRFGGCRRPPGLCRPRIRLTGPRLARASRKWHGPRAPPPPQRVPIDLADRKKRAIARRSTARRGAVRRGAVRCGAARAAAPARPSI